MPERAQPETIQGLLRINCSEALQVEIDLGTALLPRQTLCECDAHGRGNGHRVVFEQVWAVVTAGRCVKVS